MSRRSGPMSAVVMGLLVLVGGSSLVSYALVARRLTPAASLARPHIMGVAPSPAATAADGATIGPRHAGAAQQTLPGGAASGPLATVLKVAVLLTPGPSSSSTPEAPAAAASPAATPTPEPSPSGTPQPEPSPTEVEPTPAATISPTPTPTESPPTQPVTEAPAPAN